MEKTKAQKIIAMIQQHSDTLKNPPKDDETAMGQFNKTLENIRIKRNKIFKEDVADYLFQEGYASSFDNALVLSDAISESWFTHILEAIPARRATVMGINRIPGAAQRAVSREDRRAAALARREERKAAIKRDREYAEKRRKNPKLLAQEAQKRTLPQRMARAAERLGLE